MLRWIDWATINLADDHLIAVIHPDNDPSARLAQRLGFTLDRRETVRGLEVVVYRLDLDAETVSTPAPSP